MATENQHATSTGGDPVHMPDGVVAQITNLGLPPKGQVLSEYKTGPTLAVPGSQEINPKEAPGFTSFQSPGEPGYLGQDTDDYNSTLKDANYPTVPDPEFPGAAGTTNMGPQGDQIAWDAIGKYTYGEYPCDPPLKVGGGRALVEGP